jgi:Holliday junction resolvasome RuvABC endonuclease subunit
MSKKCLAIDHGKTTGYAVLEHKVTPIVGTFTLQEKELNERLVEFYGHIDKLIQEYKPDIIACEFPSDMINAQTARQLIGYYTIVKLLAGLYNIPVEECYISTVRKLVTGTGRAEKINVCDSLALKLKIDRSMLETPIYYKSKTDKYAGKVKDYIYDKSDALALAYYTLYKEGKWAPNGTLPYDID